MRDSPDKPQSSSPFLLKRPRDLEDFRRRLKQEAKGGLVPSPYCKNNTPERAGVVQAAGPSAHVPSPNDSPAPFAILGGGSGVSRVPQVGDSFYHKRPRAAALAAHVPSSSLRRPEGTAAAPDSPPFTAYDDPGFTGRSSVDVDVDDGLYNCHRSRNTHPCGEGTSTVSEAPPAYGSFPVPDQGEEREATPPKPQPVVTAGGSGSGSTSTGAELLVGTRSDGHSYSGVGLRREGDGADPGSHAMAKREDSGAMAGDQYRGERECVNVRGVGGVGAGGTNIYETVAEAPGSFSQDGAAAAAAVQVAYGSDGTPPSASFSPLLLRNDDLRRRVSSVLGQPPVRAFPLQQQAFDYLREFEQSAPLWAGKMRVFSEERVLFRAPTPVGNDHGHDNHTRLSSDAYPPATSLTPRAMPGHNDGGSNLRGKAPAAAMATATASHPHIPSGEDIGARGMSLAVDDVCVDVVLANPVVHEESRTGASSSTGDAVRDLAPHVERLIAAMPNGKTEGDLARFLESKYGYGALEPLPYIGRSFLVCTPRALWNSRYRKKPPGSRHVYEIIREGSPCHLYFDLEFDRPANPSLDGEALVDELLVQVAQELKERFRIRLQPAWVFELDSTTAKKFSRHVIVRVFGCAFKDNSHVNAFVRRVVDRICQRTKPIHELFFVRKKNKGVRFRSGTGPGRVEGLGSECEVSGVENLIANTDNHPLAIEPTSDGGNGRRQGYRAGENPEKGIGSRETAEAGHQVTPGGPNGSTMARPGHDAALRHDANVFRSGKEGTIEGAGHSLSPPPPRPCLVTPPPRPSEEWSFFVDPAVYTRNRAFRLYMSCKASLPLKEQSAEGTAISAEGTGAALPWAPTGSSSSATAAALPCPSPFADEKTASSYRVVGGTGSLAVSSGERPSFSLLSPLPLRRPKPAVLEAAEAAAARLAGGPSLALASSFSLVSSNRTKEKKSGGGSNGTTENGQGKSGKSGKSNEDYRNTEVNANAPPELRPTPRYGTLALLAEAKSRGRQEELELELELKSRQEARNSTAMEMEMEVEMDTSSSPSERTHTRSSHGRMGQPTTPCGRRGGFGSKADGGRYFCNGVNFKKRVMGVGRRPHGRILPGTRTWMKLPPRWALNDSGTNKRVDGRTNGTIIADGRRTTLVALYDDLIAERLTSYRASGGDYFFQRCLDASSSPVPCSRDGGWEPCVRGGETDDADQSSNHNRNGLRLGEQRQEQEDAPERKAKDGDKGAPSVFVPDVIISSSLSTPAPPPEQSTSLASWTLDPSDEELIRKELFFKCLITCVDGQPLRLLTSYDEAAEKSFFGQGSSNVATPYTGVIHVQGLHTPANKMNLPSASHAGTAAPTYDSHSATSGNGTRNGEPTPPYAPVFPSFGAAGGGGGSVVWQGPGASPFALLNVFIEKVANEHGVPSSIRSWSVSVFARGQEGRTSVSSGCEGVQDSTCLRLGDTAVQTGLVPTPLHLRTSVSLSVRGCRWCDQAGRQHKSNGIFFVADLSRGVWYRRCYDPDCRTARPSVLPLPEDIWREAGAEIFRRASPDQRRALVTLDPVGLDPSKNTTDGRMHRANGDAAIHYTPLSLRDMDMGMDEPVSAGTLDPGLSGSPRSKDAWPHPTKGFAGPSWDEDDEEEEAALAAAALDLEWRLGEGSRILSGERL